tara:strand:+ start:146 stop:352 length:207 start_codon:yes stop_codon:yes gene_type:complete
MDNNTMLYQKITDLEERLTEVVQKQEERVKELESLTDRQTIALETTHSRLQVLEDKMYTVECNHPTGH